jgi:hypothetical protein
LFPVCKQKSKKARKQSKEAKDSNDKDANQKAGQNNAENNKKTCNLRMSVNDYSKIVRTIFRVARTATVRAEARAHHILFHAGIFHDGTPFQLLHPDGQFKRCFLYF